MSVVVPFFEMQDWIDPCLESIRADRGTALEILIVDDGSYSPAARAKLDALRSTTMGDAELSVISKRNGGLGSARNLGIARARGEFVLPLDGDDLIVPGYLEAAVRALDLCPELGFVSCISSLFADGRSPETENDWIVPYDPDLAMLCLENGAGTAAAVFRRSLLIRYAYREDLPAYEDWDLHLRLAADGVAGASLPVVFHRYRQRRDGLSRLAHRHHDQLVARLLAPRFEGADPALVAALEIHVGAVSRLRGLGGGLGGRLDMRERLLSLADGLYRRRLKSWMTRALGDARRDRFAARIRDVLSGRGVS